MAAVRWSPSEPLKVWVGLTGLATAAGVLGVTIRQRRALLASLHEKAARLEFERDQEGRLAAAAERARIAREMHDIVAHNLSVMIALADGATYAMDTSPERAAAGDPARLGDRPRGAGRDAPAARRAARGVRGPSARAAAEPRPARRAPGTGQRRRDPGDDGSRRRPARACRRCAADRVPGGAGGSDQHAQARRPSHLRASGAELPLGTWSSWRSPIRAADEPWRARAGVGCTACASVPRPTEGKLEAGPRPQGGWRVHLRLNPDAEGALR